MESVANTVVEKCGSTNDLARKLGEQGCPNGTWVSTRIQENGRGRLGRKWESLEGNLFLSVVLRLENKSLWTWIPMGAAIATAHAVGKAFPQYSIPVRVKWPNDLWVNGRKLGGILCEAVGNRSSAFVIVGIGMNCAFSPEGLDQPTTSLSEAAGAKVIADQVRDFVIEEILKTAENLSELGISWLTQEFETLAAFPKGTEITWGDNQTGQTRQTGQTGQSGQTGTIQRLGDAGELIVTTSDGEEIRLYAEDVKIRPKGKNL